MKLFKSSIFGLLLIGLFMSCSKTNEEVNPNSTRIYFPNGCEVLIKSHSFNLQWGELAGNEVLLELVDPTGKVIQIAHTANTGSFAWDVPVELEAGDGYKLRITGENSSPVESAQPFAISEPFETGTFTDPRDGQTYQTVKIGDTWWLAENCNYNNGSGSFYYFDDSTTWQKYGRLYTWATAKTCAPEGWHLPTDDEWNNLEMALGLDAAFAKTEGWRGTNQGLLLMFNGGSGFNASYGGYYNAMFDLYGHEGFEARYWTSSPSNSDSRIWMRLLHTLQGGIDRRQSTGTFGASVRLVKDE
nr:hypothetical protein [Bacteroidota bacterium]